jgi:hypothetical protein
MEYLGLWFVIAIVGAVVAGKKGRSAVGFFFYGLIFPLIALIHALLLKPSAETTLLHQVGSGRFPCIFCTEFVHKMARVCPHCQRDLPEDWTLQAIERLRAQEL